MKQRHYKYAVYVGEHAAFFTEVHGRYRWLWSATLAAWWIRMTADGLGMLWTWVREEDVWESRLPAARIHR